MEPKFIRCEYCQVKIPLEACKLAAHTAVIEGKEYRFCCVNCADRFKQKKEKPK